MLKKLLKYDVAAIWKIWLPISLGVIVMSLVMSLTVRATLETSGSSTSDVFLALMMFFTIMATVIGWAGLWIATPLLCYIRYYKNFFSDQGYLTFTLPVKRRDLYLSKVINALIWSVGNALVTLVALSIIGLIVPTPEVSGQIINPVVFQSIGELLKLLWDLVSGWTIVYFLEVLVLMVIAALYSIGMFHMCITIGSVIAKKRKVLTAVGLYLGINFLLSFVSNAFSLFFSSPLTGFFSLLENYSDARQCVILAVALLIVILVAAVMTAVYHLVTLHLIERKLNLS